MEKGKLFLTVLVVLTVVFIVFKALEIRSLEKEIAYRESRVASFEKVVTKQEKKLDSIEEKNKEEKNNKFLSNLEQAASNYGLKLVSLTSGEKGRMGKQLAISLQGDYFSLVDFLEELAKSQEAIAINLLELEVKGEILQANIKLEVIDLQL